MIDLIERGSNTAKNGFNNEDDVINRFNNWKLDLIAQDWLKAMGYNINEIEHVKANKIKGSFKADVQVQINVDLIFILLNHFNFTTFFLFLIILFFYHNIIYQ